ncbi:hypothetical protein TNCV_2594191 [Trichonephila clavipes]|nr:hypothetical protein TNCV_2594191 [Trichonephila clavipes]
MQKESQKEEALKYLNFQNCQSEGLFRIEKRIRIRMSEISGIREENMKDSPIESEFNEITPEQVCNNLQLLWGLARSKEAKLAYIKAELAIQEKTPIFNKEKVENFIMDTARLEDLQSSLGEIALISCPIVTCKVHYPRGNNPNDVDVKPKSPRGNPNDVNIKPKSDINPKNLNSKIIMIELIKLKDLGQRSINSLKRPLEPLRKSP